VTDFETIRRVQNVYYLPVRKPPETAMALLLGGALAAAIVAVCFAGWAFVALAFSFA
jgi:hypothetical protein